jgi:sialate O-acetylesterase
MQSRIGKILVAFCVVVCASMAFAEVKVAEVFGDGMVLQRDLPLPVWGTASPGETITVSFKRQRHRATADAQGKWMVTLKPLKTSKTEKEMVIKGSNTIAFNGILVGEVWFCCGQSNMEERFRKSGGDRIDPEVFDRDLSGFRFLSKKSGWRRVVEEEQHLISRVAYYFGIELYDELDIPVGLIIRASGGTSIQSWMSTAVAEEIRNELDIPENWHESRETSFPGVQFTEGLDPFVPVAIRGVIWYQGERNAKTFTGWEYKDLLPRLIESWRVLWAERSGLGVRNFPFYYVQVPTQEDAPHNEWAWLRDGMRRTLDTTKNTGMAVFYDYGPSLHPENKEPAGQRLALWALAKDYGRTDLVYCGPLLDEVRMAGDKAVLSFKHVGGGLRSVSGGKDLKFFDIAGKDGKYQPAHAWIDGDTVVLRNAEIAEPVYVRYLHTKTKGNAEISLVNAEGLPASSFLTDDFMPPFRRR